jgi:hypothetical protein
MNVVVNPGRLPSLQNVKFWITNSGSYQAAYKKTTKPALHYKLCDDAEFHTASRLVACFIGPQVLSTLAKVLNNSVMQYDTGERTVEVCKHQTPGHSWTPFVYTNGNNSFVKVHVVP